MSSLFITFLMCYFYLGVQSHKEINNTDCEKGKEIMQYDPKRNGIKSRRGSRCFPGICGIFGKSPGSPINHERDEIREKGPNKNNASIETPTETGNSSNGKNKQVAESPMKNGNTNSNYEDELLRNSHSESTSPISREQLRLHILNEHLEPSFKRAIHILSEMAKKLGNFESCDKTVVLAAMTQQLKACKRVLGQILEEMGRKLTEQEQILFTSLDNQLDLVGDYAQEMDRKNINEILILLDISKEFEQFMELAKTMPKD